MTLTELPLTWRARAAQLRRYAPAAAQAFEDAATDLEKGLSGYLDEPLTLPQAAKESGYSADYLGELVRDGALPNAGRKGKPAIKRRFVPKKATRKEEEPTSEATSAAPMPAATSRFEEISRAAMRGRGRRRA